MGLSSKNQKVEGRKRVALYKVPEMYIKKSGVQGGQCQ